MRTKKVSAPPAGEVGECRQWPEKFASDEPTKAVAAALGIGILINFLPIGKIAGLQIDVDFAVVRPLLLWAGLLKLSEFCRFGCAPDNWRRPIPTRSAN